MSRRKEKARPGPKRPADPVQKLSPLTGRAIILSVAIAVIGAAGLVYYLHGAPRATPLSASSVAAAPAQTFQPLKGRWLRPDGGYVIEIREIDAAGKLNAAYFNPQPIKVAKAEALQEGGAIKVFLELRDVGYPGSTYTLTYDPATDQLKGAYFQAAMRQTFEVGFVRLK